MHAWRVHQEGDYHDVLRWEQCGHPEAQPGSAVIKVSAAAVNFPDLLFIAGKYQMHPPLPFTPGIEAVGEVVDVGEGSQFEVGDRVIATGMGGFAEYMLALDATSFRAPSDMPDTEAAAFRIVYQTAYMAFVRRARLAPGETLVIHGGAGGVGTAATQVGKALGARVLATAHTDEHLQVCRDIGADEVTDFATTDLVSWVKGLTDGQGADIFFDPVGGAAFDASTHCVAFEGRIIVIGFASGTIPEVRTNLILNKNIDVLGMYRTNYEIFHPELVDQAQHELNKMYTQEKIKPVVSRTLPLDDLPAALDAMAHHENYGKIVLVA